MSTIAPPEPASAERRPSVETIARKVESSREADGARDGLTSTSFLALLATQFLVALNDNMFRWLIIPIGKELVGQDKALTAGAVCFLLPFVLLSSLGGYLADRFSKRSVMIGCKVAEIFIMVAGIVAILGGNVPCMFGVLFLMGAQSALFSPSKFGCIPEIVHADRIPAANGIIGMTTMVAVILGTVAGGVLYSLTVPAGTTSWWISAAALVGVASLGLVVSLWIGPLRAANPGRPFSWNPAGEVVHDLRILSSRRPLLLAALAGMFFWSLALLAQINVDKFAVPELVTDQQYVGPLMAVLTLGIGLGSLLAGIWSGGRVEVGIVPFGTAGIALSSVLLWTVPQGVGHPLSAPYGWACLWLLVMGVSAGLFDIPVQSFLQYRSPEKNRGAVLAANNFLSFSGMLGASVVFWLLASKLGLSARTIFLIGGIATVPVVVAMVWRIPAAVVRVALRLLVQIFYRVDTEGLRNVPERGGALLVANHVTWLDGLLLLLFSPRPVRIIAYSDYVSGRFLGRLADEVGVIPIMPGDRRSVTKAIRTARQALRDGELVCIFPEGALTPTGELQAFQPGFLTILKDSGTPLVPVYLGGLWGSVFSFEGGKYFWKRPRRVPYPVSIRFGTPMDEVADSETVFRAIEELRDTTMTQNSSGSLIPARIFLRKCRKRMRSLKTADSTGAELTGSGLLTRTLALRRLLRREVLDDDERYVGVLMPPSVAGLVVNASLTVDSRVAVNLNYTVSSDVMNLCIARCGIRRVLTSRRVLERFDLKMNAEIAYLEDLKDRFTLVDKVTAASQAWLWPVGLLERHLGLTKIRPDDTLTVIFTSGSTGDPKGVVLTHANVGANIDAFNAVINFRSDDTVLGSLPFFHSFGYTTTLWSALTMDARGVYHFSPLDYRQVGALCRKYKGTVMVSTATFLRTYLRRCPPEDFASLEVLVTGAEKLPMELADAFEQKFGVRPYEGYGTTELSPVVAFNVAPSRRLAGQEPINKRGTIGKPIPGVFAKVVDLDTGEDLGPNQPGMLLVSGHCVMKGYFGDPEKTAEVMRGKWYVTGDIALIDEEGYIQITGRQSRFSKIGGEMVPHLRIEEILMKVLGIEEDELRLAVASVPDPRKGERIVVLHTGLDRRPEEICRDMIATGMPSIWVPSPDSFCEVPAIPVLGTGKLDLRQLKLLAEERFCVSE